MLLLHWPPRHMLVSSHSFTSVFAHTHAQTHRRHQHDALGAAVNVRKAMHRLRERATNYSRYTVTVHRNGRSQQSHKFWRVQANRHTAPYLHTRGRWVPPRSPGHRPCRRRSPLCWCKHPGGTHLGSGTRQCLRDNRRRREG